MILLVYGTRPEWIKIKPLIDEMVKQNIPFKTLFTGQHKDLVKNDADFNLNKIQTNNKYTGFDSENRLDNILNECTSLPDECFEDITYVLVQGDTTSALGVALAAFNRKIKIIHLEAGLRTYDYNNPYPEEMNRQMISRISDIHLCPTLNNLTNLENELVNGNIYVVGNTALDNILKYKEKCEYTDKVLVTLHRRENHDKIDLWFKVINELAIENPKIEFILPIHPNPNVQKYKNMLTNVTICEALPHDELLDLLVKTKLVITDSGGLQEECSFLDKKCLVCREITERPESIDLSTFMVNSPDNLKKIFYKHIKSFKIEIESPYGDGYASIKICEILKKLMMDNKVDVVICITSYNRYDSVKYLINQLLTQRTKYTYQILLINDASSDSRYVNFNNYSDKLTYINKSINGGKNGYYQTINKVWELIPNYDCNYIIQTDDDFILCDNFLDTLVDEFILERIKNDKLFSLCPHLYSFSKVSKHEAFWLDTKTVDGITIMTPNVLENLNYKLSNPGNVNKTGVSVGVWQQIATSIKELRGITKRTNYSLVYHNNVNGSVMHGEFRKKKMIFTQKFYDKLPESVINYDKNYDLSRGGSLPNKKTKEEVKTNNNMVQVPTRPKKEPDIKTDITSKPKKLYKAEDDNKTLNNKPKLIGKIADDLFVGKLRKKNLRFGKR
jgi:UDP-N-acetylglucosamine 2-epimerase